MIWFGSQGNERTCRNFSNYKLFHFRDGEPYVYRVLDWRNTTKSLIVFISVVIFGIMLHNLMFVIYKLRVLFYNLTMAKPVKPKVEEGNDGCGGHV